MIGYENITAKTCLVAKLNMVLVMAFGDKLAIPSGANANLVV